MVTIGVAYMAAALAAFAIPSDPPAAPAAEAPTKSAAPAVPDEAPSDPALKAKPSTTVEFPHPLITEVLFAVPGAGDGDANGDGKRDAAGDEFVEFINPHDRPINLRGYTITDRNEGRAQLRFVFPALELPPGGVVVVFNGQSQKWKGPVGDSKAAPAEGNAAFHGAYVFTMNASSSSISWANGGDWVLLSDPSGEPVHCIWWGKFAEKIPEKGLIEEAPTPNRSSVSRRDAGSALLAHAEFSKSPLQPRRVHRPFRFARTPAGPALRPGLAPVGYHLGPARGSPWPGSPRTPQPPKSTVAASPTSPPR